MHQYGRGKFEASPNYIQYMKMIVSHPNYAGMPNAVSSDGRINWQVSSGKTTSFYKFYLARKEWWVNKANSLGVPGRDDENGRLTMAARLIHPTGYRTCRLCGRDYNVGYFYMNQLLVTHISKLYPQSNFQKSQPITDLLQWLNINIEPDKISILLQSKFPERIEFFKRYGMSKEAFERSNYLKSSFLSPGFMGNPPDRLDGFHDYHLECRKQNDPGRGDENMRSYNHDRRSFEWWAEGNWALVDALYNKAGAGACSIPGCGKVLEKVSPDHVGPLACGFKQIPLLEPTCQNHNSAKNRRFSFLDVQRLIKYEESTGDNAASWQVQAHWNKYKLLISNDNQSKVLSNSLRSLQDMYMRVLWDLFSIGHVRLLFSLLAPKYALYDYIFSELNASNFTYSGVQCIENNSMLRKRFSCRVVRIAFESLEEYVKKEENKRKLVRNDYSGNIDIITHAIRSIPLVENNMESQWRAAVNTGILARMKESYIGKLIFLDYSPCAGYDLKARQTLQNLFDYIGTNAEVDFSRYGE